MNNDTPSSESEDADAKLAAVLRDYVPGSAHSDDEAIPGGSEDVARLLVESFPPEEPDPTVWARISASIASDAAVTSVTSDFSDPQVVPLAPRRKVAWPAIFSIAAVFLAVLGTAVIMNASSDGSTSVASSVFELTDPSTGAVTATVSTDADGNALVTSVGLAALPASETYQLWSVIGDEVVSVGLLGADPDEVPLRIEGDPAVLALTVEVAGGVAVSEATPVAVWQASS